MVAVKRRVNKSHGLTLSHQSMSFVFIVLLDSHVVAEIACCVFKWSTCGNKGTVSGSVAGCERCTAQPEKDLIEEAEYDRSPSLWNVAIKSDFRSEEWQLKALQTVSARGQRCSPHQITWAEMKHDPPSTLPPPPSHHQHLQPCSSPSICHHPERPEREREREGEREREYLKMSVVVEI